MLLATDGRPLISTTEAHKRSGLSRDHIGLLIRRGILAATRVGNYWLIYEESLEQFSRHTTQAWPQRPTNSQKRRSAPDYPAKPL